MPSVSESIPFAIPIKKPPIPKNANMVDPVKDCPNNQNANPKLINAMKK
jgi:hypothetical protein